MTTSKRDIVNQKSYLMYSLPVISANILFAPMAIAQGVFAKHYGISLSVLAFILLISRFVDAITDPIIGYGSDRYFELYGSRKPLIVIGGLLSITCAYFIFVPPTVVTSYYVGFWFIAFYIAYTLFEIPHLTWPSDFSVSSEKKAGFYSSRVAGVYAGLIIFYSIPLLPIFESNAVTPETLKLSFIVGAVILLPTLIASVKYLPNGERLKCNHPVKPFAFKSVGLLLKEVSNNKPFIVFAIAFLCYGFANGMWYGLIYIYVDGYLDMGVEFAKMFLIAFVVGIAATPLCYQLSVRIGKKETWFIGVVILLISFLATGFLSPGQTKFWHLLLLKIIQTTGFVCVTAITPAILADIIDYGHWKYGTDNNAAYFSFKFFLEKTNVAIGSATALAIAGWYGFDVSAVDHEKVSVEGLKLAIAWIPSIICAFSLIFIAAGPINEKRHKAIARRLSYR